VSKNEKTFLSCLEWSGDAHFPWAMRLQGNKSQLDDKENNLLPRVDFILCYVKHCVSVKKRKGNLTA